MSKEKRLVPELRFPEFDGLWGQDILKKRINFFNGKGHEKSIVENGEFKLVNSKFVSTDGKIFKTTNEQLCPLLKDDITIVMSDLPNGKALAKTFIIDKDNSYTLNQRIGGLRMIEDNAKFLSEQINRNSYYLRFNDGVNQTNLKKDEVLGLIVYIPTLNEQQKIANFLSLIDKKIELLERKVELLEEQKRGLLQQVFSQEIRFKKDDGSGFEEWKHAKLKEIVTYHSSNISQNSIDETLSSGYEVYGAQGVIGYNDTYKFDKPYIAMIKDGASVGRIQKCKPFTNAISTLGIIMNNKKSLIDFLYYQLDTVNIIKLVVGSTIPHLYFRDYGNLDLLVPSVEEQSRIANFFNKQDILIEQTKYKTEKMNELKKGLMQKLFI